MFGSKEEKFQESEATTIKFDGAAIIEIVNKAQKYDELLKPFPGKKELNCSFCGKRQSDVEKIIAGPMVYICNECVDLCNDILKEEKENDKEVCKETNRD
jgi:hypothetical protein